MKKTIKILLQSVSFVVAFIIALSGLSMVFVPKNDPSHADECNYITKAYKGETANTIDAFMVGNSDLYRAVSPPVFWKETGLTACVSGKGLQTPKGAYKILKDMYDTQSPSLVIIETDMLFAATSDYTRGEKLKKTLTDAKRIAKSLLTDFDDAAISGMSYYFPIFKFHDRWQQLKTQDITAAESCYKSKYKGYIAEYTVKGYSGGFDYMQAADMNAVEEIPKKSQKHLKKMLELCRKKGSRVVFLEVPSASSWTMARHNAVKKLADENNIPFVDFNTAVPRGFDWSIHSLDGGDHLNAYGAQIISEHLGKYINDTCPLTSKSPTEAAHWNALSEAYSTEMTMMMKNQKI